ncbi:NUDIX domain-containing protein [Candidatus Peregrinibacteria bacterium]|nr:NUDIX domain-containing protein [Candidatus Peregrinibacteria bacterium]
MVRIRRTHIDGKPVRVGAVIMAQPGKILLVKDRKDRYLKETQEKISSRRSKTKHQINAALAITATGKLSTPGGGIEESDYDEREALARELEEELNLHADPGAMEEVCVIIGQNRAHVLYVVTALGHIVPNPNENISGIGILEERSVIPLTHDFNQQHVIQLHNYFFKLSKDEQHKYGQMTGNLRLNLEEAEKWYQDEMHAHKYRGSRHINPPQMLESTINFSLLDQYGEKIPPKDPLMRFTRSKRAGADPKYRQAANFDTSKVTQDPTLVVCQQSSPDLSTCQSLADRVINSSPNLPAQRSLTISTSMPYFSQNQCENRTSQKDICKNS